MTQVMNSPTTTDVPNFTPSLGLRYWMNRMKGGNSQHNNDTISSKSTTTDGVYTRPMNDTTSAVSVSGTTTHSFIGVDSLHAYDIDSSLRVLHHHTGGCASSERSSFMSDDIQSNASIKSKPWISQLLSTNDHHTSSIHSIDPPNLVLPHQGTTCPLVDQNKTYDEDDDDDDDDYDENNEDDYTGMDGDILYSTTTSSSYSVAYHSSLHSIRSAEDIQPASAINSEDENGSYTDHQQQQPQPQRRWSDHQYPPPSPRPLGRIKAGLGRLMGREHSTMENRGSLV